MDTATPRTGIFAGFLSEEELAQQLKRCERTLARWRKRKIGPPYTMIGREPFYDFDAARMWLANGGTARIRNKARRKG